MHIVNQIEDTSYHDGQRMCFKSFYQTRSIDINDKNTLIPWALKKWLQLLEKSEKWWYVNCIFQIR